MSQPRVKLAREDWIVAAREAFVTSGIDSVKIDTLAKKLKVTRGSFYWHFKDLDDLQSALLDDWQKHNLTEMDQIRDRWLKASPNLNDIGFVWLTEDADFPAFGMAVRIWARKEAMVANIVRSIDHAWIKLIELAFRAYDYGEMESQVRARVLYFHRVGYHALPMNETAEEFCALAPYFYSVLTGKQPDDNHRDLVADYLQKSSSRKRRKT